MHKCDLTHFRLFNSNKSYTLPFENRKNVAVIALNNDSNILLSIDEGTLLSMKPDGHYLTLGT